MGFKINFLKCNMVCILGSSVSTGSSDFGYDEKSSVDGEILHNLDAKAQERTWTLYTTEEFPYKDFYLLSLIPDLGLLL